MSPSPNWPQRADEANPLEQELNALATDVRNAKKDVAGIRTTDFRILCGAIVAIGLVLAGLLARGFHWL